MAGIPTPSQLALADAIQDISALRVARKRLEADVKSLRLELKVVNENLQLLCAAYTSLGNTQKMMNRLIHEFGDRLVELERKELERERAAEPPGFLAPELVQELFPGTPRSLPPPPTTPQLLQL